MNAFNWLAMVSVLQDEGRSAMTIATTRISKKENMNLEAKEAKPSVRAAIASQPKYSDSHIGSPNSPSRIIMASLEWMTVDDWNALKLEIHQKLERLKQSADGCWLRAKSDLESKIAGLERLIKISNPIPAKHDD